jgi:hypothetical protein
MHDVHVSGIITFYTGESEGFLEKTD